MTTGTYIEVGSTLTISNIAYKNEKLPKFTISSFFRQKPHMHISMHTNIGDNFMFYCIPIATSFIDIMKQQGRFLR